MLRGIAGTAVLAAMVLDLTTAAEAGTRVIGGSEANPGAWPFQAYVAIHTADGRELFCGGTLVAPNYVLTAGHCAQRTASEYQVRLGSTERQTGGTVHHVSRVIAHEGFNKSNQLENDIALLELVEPSNLPIVTIEGLPDRRLARAVVRNADPWAKILGWGRVDPSDKGKVSEHLLEASLRIVDSDVCNRSLPNELRPYGAIDARRLCAGMSEGGVDTCNGDSGGPILAQAQTGGYVQIGLVSYGVNQCGAPNTYGIYTRLAGFSGWLKSHLGAGPVTTPAPPAVAAASPFATASTILEAAAKEDGQIIVDLTPRADLKLGQEFRVQVKSAFDGYLLLLDIGADGKITQLFPNARSAKIYADGRIKAGSVLTLPDASYGFALRAAEPFGRGRIIAVVASSRRGLEDLTRAQDGASDRASGDVGNDRLGRLEVVLKPQYGAPAGASPESGHWAAGQRDYVVSR